MTSPSRADRVTCWASIDNSCALYLLIKCSSKKKKTAKIGAEVAGVLRLLGSSAYYDYIRTELNPGDSASRADLLDSLVRMFGPRWRTPSPEMLNTDSWDTAFDGAKRRPIKSEWESIFGGKRLKVKVGGTHGYVML